VDSTTNPRHATPPRGRGNAIDPDSACRAHTLDLDLAPPIHGRVPEGFKHRSRANVDDVTTIILAVNAGVRQVVMWPGDDVDEKEAIRSTRKRPAPLASMGDRPRPLV